MNDPLLPAFPERRLGGDDRYRVTFDEVAVGLTHVAADGRRLRVNRRMCQMLGYSEHDLLDQAYTDLVHPDDQAELQALRAQLFAGQIESFSMERRFRHREGHWIWSNATVSLIRDASGSPDFTITAVENIGARRQAEQALRDSEARNRLLAAVVDQTTEAIITKDLDNVVLTWNRGACALFGYTAEEAIGQNITRLVAPGADANRVETSIAEARAARTCTRFEARRARDGRIFDVEVTYSPLYDAHGGHAGEISVSRDITARLVAERALRASEARSRLLAAVVEQSWEAIIIKDLDNIVLSWNAGAERIYGWSSAEAVGRNTTLLVRPQASGDEVARRIARVREGRSGGWRAANRRRDGSPIHVEINVSPLYDDNGRHIGEITISRDITERVRAEEALRDHQLFLEQAQEVGGIGSWALSLTDQRTTWSDQTLRIFGITREQFDGSPGIFWRHVHPDDVDRLRQVTEQGIASGEPYAHEYRIIRGDGSQRWVYEHAAIICDDERRPLRVVGVAQDVTEQRSAQARIEFLATRDPLTELPNRLLLRDRITHGMASAARNGTLLALLFIDLDRFKTINDSLGHRVGDELLKQVADRLGRCVRREDTLARLGGDEFVVLLEGLQDSQIASQVARKVLKLLSRPYLIEGHQLSTSCSIGISLYPSDGTDAQTLMKNADAAMYHAKESGRGNYRYFSADLHARAVERLSIETALRRALDRGEFELHFQPQVRIDNAQVVGMEALLRWNHPEQGLLPPSSFIRVAEESGLIVPLGDWALNAACAQVRRWLDQGFSPPRLAVNVSVGQISRGFVRSVGRILQQHRIEGAMVELEMTESLLMQHVDENVKLLRRMGELGVQMALDDFGTGYSSLAYLKKFPIDALKIDRTFVRDIVDDPDDSAIIAAVIAVGHHMQLRVVAEGVETDEQLRILRSMACDEYQGYLFSRPLPAEAFRERFLMAGGLPSGARAAPAASRMSAGGSE